MIWGYEALPPSRLLPSLPLASSKTLALLPPAQARRPPVLRAIKCSGDPSKVATAPAVLCPQAPPRMAHIGGIVTYGTAGEGIRRISLLFGYMLTNVSVRPLVERRDVEHFHRR